MSWKCYLRETPCLKKARHARRNFPDPPRRNRLEPLRPAHLAHRPAAHRRRKAGRAGRWARNSAGRDFALVLSSPMQRALETCRLAGLQAAIDPNLNEWNYGAYEGLTSEDIHKTWPGWTIWTGTPPEGESADQVGGRADRVIERCWAFPVTWRCSAMDTCCGCSPRAGWVWRRIPAACSRSIPARSAAWMGARAARNQDVESSRIMKGWAPACGCGRICLAWTHLWWPCCGRLCSSAAFTRPLATDGGTGPPFDSAGLRGLADLRGGPRSGRLARSRHAAPPRVLPPPLAGAFFRYGLLVFAATAWLAWTGLPRQIFARGAWLGGAVMVYFAAVHASHWQMAQGGCGRHHFRAGRVAGRLDTRGNPRRRTHRDSVFLPVLD